MSSLPMSGVPTDGSAMDYRLIEAAINRSAAEPRHAEPTLGTVGAALRRRWLFIALWMTAAVGVAGLAVISLEPRYQAEALLLVDPRPIRLSEVGSVASSIGSAASGDMVRSELSVLESPAMIRRMVSELELAEHPAFQPRPGLLARMISVVADRLAALDPPFDRLAPLLQQFAEEVPAEADPDERFVTAIETYKDGIKAYNDGRSHVIELSFETLDPELAATIVNRHALTYLELQRETKRSALADAMSWLDREVGDLAARVREAEAAVQAYREEHRLFAPLGAPVVQRQLAEISAQLAVARAGLVEREARLRQAREAIDGSVAAEIVQSDAIAGLRQQELETSRRLADARGDMGERHPTIIKLRSELDDVRRLIAREEQKIIQSLLSEAEIARQREAELARSVARFETELAQSERAGGRLRDLERQAEAVRSLYESLLSQQEEVATQIGMPQADAKLVSPAIAPRKPSYPRRHLLFAIALIGAGASAAGLALAIDRRRSGFDSIDDVEAATGLRRVVALPGVRRPFTGSSMALPHQIAVQPRSAAAEAVRTLRATLAMQGNRITNLLAVTSSLPGEGKTSVALALGRSLALSGASVLLIEADLRRHSLARYGRGARARPGIVRVLEEDLPIDDAVVKDRATPLHLLPAEGSARSPQDLLGPDRFGRLIREAAASYDYVIVDTPPIGAVADALLIGRLVSAMLLVVRAGSTTRATVQGTIRTMADLGLPLAGIVLNAASPRRSSAYRY